MRRVSRVQIGFFSNYAVSLAMVAVALGGAQRAAGQTAKIYWAATDVGKIQRADLNGDNEEDVVPGLPAPAAIALDPLGGKVYWTDFQLNKIRRANLNGSGVEDLPLDVDAGAGLAVDPGAGKIYWTDRSAERVRRADLNGGNIEDLVTTVLDHPWGIAVDPAGGKLYWMDYLLNKIERANLDGSDRELLVDTGTNSGLFFLALDLAEGKMYWTENGFNRIRRADLDGNDVENVVTEGLTTPVGIAVDFDSSPRKLYWADQFIDKIQRADLDGQNGEDVVTELSDPLGIALLDACPNDPNKMDPGACGCGTPDTDSDGDGTSDCNDNCPNDPNKVNPGDCGCGTPDTDSDGDGTSDCNDNCPNDPNKVNPGDCGCGTPDSQFRMWCRDDDDDTYGDPSETADDCEQPSGYVSDCTDCDDDCSTCHPGAPEVADGKDNDCDGEVDEGGAGQTLTWYRDADGDGYGNPNDSTQAAEQPRGYVSDNTDCDDNDATVHPGASEICDDGKDNDCDAQTDCDDSFDCPPNIGCGTCGSSCAAMAPFMVVGMWLMKIQTRRRRRPRSTAA